MKNEDGRMTTTHNIHCKCYYSIIEDIIRRTMKLQKPIFSFLLFITCSLQVYGRLIKFQKSNVIQLNMDSRSFLRSSKFLNIRGGKEDIKSTKINSKVVIYYISYLYLFYVNFIAVVSI
jgi:hypothetical protein